MRTGPTARGTAGPTICPGSALYEEAAPRQPGHDHSPTGPEPWPWHARWTHRLRGPPDRQRRQGSAGAGSPAPAL